MRRESTEFLPNVAVGRRQFTVTIFLIISVILASLLVLPSPYNLVPFVIIFGASFLFMTFRYPMIGVFIYMLLFFIRPQELFPDVAAFQYPYERIVAIIVLLNLIIDSAFNGRRINFFEMDKAVLAVLIAASASVITALWLGGALTSLENFLKILAVYFFLARIINSESQLKLIVWLYVLSIAFVAISSAVNYYAGHFMVAMGIQRAVGLGQEGSAYGDPNTMAATMLLGVPFIYFLSRSYKNVFLKAFLYLLMAAILWTIIITGSRGAMLGAGVTLVMLAWKSRRRILASFAVILVFVLAFAVMPGQYINRLSSITDFNTADDRTGAVVSAQGRLNGLKVGFDVLLHRPLMGVGVGCFGIYNHARTGSWLNAHNLLGQLMGEMGLLGLLGFGFFVYMLFKYLRYINYKYREHSWSPDFGLNMAAAIKICIFTLLFLGMFSHNAFRYNWYIFACFAVIIMALIKDRLALEKEAQPATDKAIETPGTQV